MSAEPDLSQLIAANVDQLVVISSFGNPAFSSLFLDRCPLLPPHVASHHMAGCSCVWSCGAAPEVWVVSCRVLVAAEICGIPKVIVVLNKVDLDEDGLFEGVKETYEVRGMSRGGHEPAEGWRRDPVSLSDAAWKARNHVLRGIQAWRLSRLLVPRTSTEACLSLQSAGYTVIGTCAKTGHGVDVLRGLLGGGQVNALYGLSGSGKSSIINCMEAGLELVTRQVSQSLMGGRHTTSASNVRFPERSMAHCFP